MGRPKRVVEFDVWGSRGSRSLIPAGSSLGNNTSCYSISNGHEVLAFDAGRGLAALAHAVRSTARFRSVRTVHVLVSHSHVDHWEGLKDCDWLWHRNNGVHVRILGPRSALAAIRSGFAHPHYVPLEILGEGTAASVEYLPLLPGTRKRVGAWSVEPWPLNHYTGSGQTTRLVDTLGYRAALPGGPTVAYVSDHEPTAGTLETEDSLLAGAGLALYDAHHMEARQHAYGHGSLEHSAEMAKRHPEALVLAGHHAPVCTDSDIRSGWRRHGKGLANFALAVEGTTYVWDQRRRAFAAIERPRPRR
jgi:phosphoribosyl 1,2-cyclic phosphodiesterase